MVSTSKMEQPEAVTLVSRFGPHVEELQEFFRSRTVRFGSAEDLEPFVERLDSDTSFRDDTASMLRAVIYRERDGLSRLELMELLSTAVGGAEVDNAATPEIREAVRQLMAFVESVFRSRRNPGAAVVGSAALAAVSAQTENAAEAAVPHPSTDVFYRAQVVASSGVPETRRVDPGAAPVAETASLDEDSDTDERWHIPLEDFAPPGEPERGSRVWLWIAGACALLLAFSAGLFVHQKMLVPLRDANQPYEAQPAETESVSPAQPPATAVPRAPRASDTTVDADWRARAGSARRRAVAPSAGTGRAAAAASGADVTAQHPAPGMIGASSGLMAGYLIYAPPAQYPALAKMTHVQGEVMVQAVVGKSGQVIEARAISGHRLLRGAAVREVYGRRYRPYLLDDRPRNVATIVAVDFRLK